MRSGIIVAWLITLSASVLAEEGRMVGVLDGQLLAAGSKRVVKLDQNGTECWSFPGQTVHDVWQLPNGNVLFADGEAKEVDPKTDTIVWSYKPELAKGGGVFGVQRLDNGVTFIGENSTGRLLEVDAKGAILFELALPDMTVGSHDNLRYCRKLKSGNYLVTHKAGKMVREYTPQGDVVLEIKLPHVAFSAVRLANGNTLVGHLEGITEFDGSGKSVWSFSSAELPDGLKTGLLCGVQRLPNGNTVCGVYRIPVEAEKSASLFEITPEKNVVWYLHAPQGDKSMMGVQKLTVDGAVLSGETLR